MNLLYSNYYYHIPQLFYYFDENIEQVQAEAIGLEIHAQAFGFATC